MKWDSALPMNTSPRRSRLEILLEILSAVSNGVNKPTRIMYSTHLSWRPVQEILRSLVDRGLLQEMERTGSKRTKKEYTITEKGENVLRYYKDAEKLLEVEN